MIKGIIFDLDQTLLDRGATFRRFIERQYERFCDNLAPVSKIDYWNSIERFDNNGYTQKKEVYTCVCNDLGLDIAPKVLLADFNESYGTDPILFGGALAVLDTLKTRYRLGLITNGRSMGQRAKLSNSGLGAFFEVVKISEEEGIKKPDPRIYDRCLKDLGLEAVECVSIGDHPINDVSTAKARGMKGIWIENTHYDAPEQCDGIARDLSELPDLIYRIKEH